MANEFIARKGIISLDSIQVSGSIIATGGITVSGSISSASFATTAATASSADNFFVRQNLTASSALFTGSITAQTLVVQTVTSSITYSSGSNIFGNLPSNVQQFTGSLRVTGSGNHFIQGGNVGIGNSTPANLLTIDGVSTCAKISIETDTVSANTVIGYLDFTNNNAGTTYGRVLGGRNSAGDGYVALGTGVSNNLYALESGYVGIGTSSPSTALHISSSTTQITLQNNAGGTNARRIGMNMTSGDTFKILSLCDNNTTRVDNIIVANVLSGNVGIGTASPNTALQVNLCSGTAYSSGATGNAITIYNTCAINNQYVGLILQGEPTAGNAGQATIYGITTGGGDMDMAFSTRGSSVLTERMRITSGGQVSINNTSLGSDFKFGIYGTGGTGNSLMAFQNANTGTANGDGFIVGSFNNVDAYVYNYENANIIFGTNATERMRITSAGNVGIGCASPSYVLDVRDGTTGSAGGRGMRLSVCSNSAGPQFRLEYQCSGNSRNWLIGTNQEASGDFIIRSSTVPGCDPGGSCSITRFSISKDGCVGIGTAFPTTSLTVEGANSAFPLTYNSGYGNIHIQTNETTATQNFGGTLTFGGLGRTSGPTEKFIWAAIAGRKQTTTSGDPKGYLQFGTLNDDTNQIAERMRISSCGNLLIGITGEYPYQGGALLRINKEQNTGTNIQINNQANNASAAAHVIFGTYGNGWTIGMGSSSSSSGNSFYFSPDPSAALSKVATLTTAGVWSTSGGGTSDRRTKKNIEYITENVIDKILLLKPAKFEFLLNPNITRRGFIAQDVLEVIPDLVLGNGEKEDGTYGLDYDGVLSLAIKAIQEQQCQICTQSIIIDQLKTCLGII